MSQLLMSHCSDFQEVQSYRERLKKETEELVVNEFPLTILKLNALMETPLFKNRNPSAVRQELNFPDADTIRSAGLCQGISQKKRKVEDEETQGKAVKVAILKNYRELSNRHILDIIETVKPHMRKLVLDANAIKHWISIMIPKIESGNNFGVTIQRDVLSIVQNVESESAACLDHIMNYFTARAQMITKVTQHPYIEDYRKAIHEMDESEYLSLWLEMCEIRNSYCALYDIIVKNLNRIKNPRSNELADSMY